MRDTLTLHPFNIKSAIVNLNTSNQPGSHWVRYYRNKTDGIYFDSYVQIIPAEIQRYLQTVVNSTRVRKLYREIQISYTLRIRQCGVIFAYSY